MLLLLSIGAWHASGSVVPFANVRVEAAAPTKTDTSTVSNDYCEQINE